MLRLKQSGLHGQEGEVEEKRYDGDSPLLKHGPLRISENGRRLEHLDTALRKERRPWNHIECI